MLRFERVEELREACAGGVCLTVGVFDGVHVGHRALIGRVADEARRRGLRSLVFTFRRHPLALLAPAHCPPELTGPEEKADLIETCGADLCLVLDFTPEFAATPPESFVADVLARDLRAKFVIAGGNFSFGARGAGDVNLLRERGAALGIDVEVLDPVRRGSGTISSTRVRDSLIQGRARDAAQMLGRPYSFPARVVSGHGRGRTIGFPTANLLPPEGRLVPADGVYAVAAEIAGKRVGGMLNVGGRPTFEGAGRAIEAHFFDFAGDLTGADLRIEFVDRVRDERKFPGVEALVAQLKTDEARCRELLAE